MRTPAKLLAIAAAGGALAIGVPAALAATDAPDTTNTPVQSATPDARPAARRRLPREGRAAVPLSAPDAPTANPEI